MWPLIWKGGRRIIGIGAGIFAAVAGIVEGADKVWPGYFQDQESQ